MTDPVMEQIYTVSAEALYAGQDRIQVQIYPFRMTEANLAAQAGHKWYGFWRNLKEGYDAFEATRLPPAVSVCRKTYVIAADFEALPVVAEDCPNEDPIVTSSAAAPKLAHRFVKPRVSASRTVRVTHLRTAHSAASRPGKGNGNLGPNRKTAAATNGASTKSRPRAKPDEELLVSPMSSTDDPQMPLSLASQTPPTCVPVMRTSSGSNDTYMSA